MDNTNQLPRRSSDGIDGGGLSDGSDALPCGHAGPEVDGECPRCAELDAEEDARDAARERVGCQVDASYDPADDKIRLRASARLKPEIYARVKAAGFSWAPKQEVFFAVWGPGREDLALELSGQDELEDEGTSLEERAAARAERFDGYSARRAADADGARRAVEHVSKRFEFGQPILVGHHSERRARKDAERIRSGMAKAVKMWKTSTYWTDRAARALAHAEYKELPAVRARRIGKLEADLRGYERTKNRALLTIEQWSSETLTKERAIALANHMAGAFYRCYPLAEFPRQTPASQYEGETSIWSALDGGIIDEHQAQTIVLEAVHRGLPNTDRWIDHLTNRLAYERAMLAESGWTPPPRPKTKSDLPILNYAGEIAYRCSYRENEVTREQAIGITKAELAWIPSEYKGTRLSECRTHRIRIAMVGPLRRVLAERGAELPDALKASEGHGSIVVYLTDSKQHPRPTPEEVALAEGEREAEVGAIIDAKLERSRRMDAAREAKRPAREAREAAAAPFRALESILKAGVTVVSAPQLFPTPAPLAARMVAAADIGPGMRVLEPSAGTGAILRAIMESELDRNRYGKAAEVVAVEINQAVAFSIPKHMATEVRAVDFLTVTTESLGAAFDVVLMNPPFERGSDIEHITHAIKFLRPGGRLVALCADGPRQREELQGPIEEMGGTYEPIEDPGFAGTNVRVAMIALTLPTN